MKTDESTQNLDQDNESDDDLLAPTTFLYSKKPFQEIHTPEKIKTPVGNDLSPITPLEKVRQKKAKVKFSFGKLIAEKVAQDEVDKKMARMEEELKGKELIEQGMSFQNSLFIRCHRFISTNKYANIFVHVCGRFTELVHKMSFKAFTWQLLLCTL